MPNFNLITWNIQWGRGCDGVVDLRRIVETARAMADFDVLCLQEVASNYDTLPGSRGEDQPSELAQLLPDFNAAYGAATDVPRAAGLRRRFGNIVLSRLPMGQVFRHLLPWPPDTVPSMQRGLVEAVVLLPFGPVRVMTTHLEYYSATQRAEQVERIRDLHADAARRVFCSKPSDDSGPLDAQPGSASAIITADFNFKPDDPEHARMMQPYDDATVPQLHDAWEVRYPGIAHPPSIGLYDRVQWPQGAYCCDFIFVTDDLKARIVDVRIDQHTGASDHQPVLLTLAC